MPSPGFTRVCADYNGVSNCLVAAIEQKNPMRDLWRPVVLVALVLAVPTVPFLLFGADLERSTEDWLAEAESPERLALGVTGILATDVFLPIPSSFVNTFAGAKLGVFVGTFAAWLGMTMGACLGFALARWFGRPLVEWMVRPDEVGRLERAGERFGPQLVIITRALPVLAEATVLLLGSTRLEWRRFFPAMALSNLGLAVVYAVFGFFAKQQGMIVVALAASIALPVLAATIARKLLTREPAH